MVDQNRLPKMNPDPSSTQRKPGALVLRGCVLATTLVVLLALLVWGTGLLPEQSVGFVFAAIMVAAVTCSLGIVLKSMALTRKTSAAGPGQLIHLVVLGDFVLQIFVLGIIMVSMHFSGVKFASSASFALAFAAVVFVFPLVATLILVKGLERQTKSESHPVEHPEPLSDLSSS